MPFFRVRFQGTMPIGDIYNFGWWVDSPQGVQDVANTAATWANNLIATGGLNSFYTTNTTFQNVVVGQYSSITGTQQARAEAAIGLDGNQDPAVVPPMPGDVCSVVSLETDLANRSGRGRFYLPAMTTNQVGPDGRMAPGVATTIVSAVVGAFGAATPGTLIVASRTLNQGTPVQRISVGDIFDTQRRRENSAVEARAASDL